MATTSRIRFTLAAQAFEDAPSLRESLPEPPEGAEPLAFLATLAASGSPVDALTYFAHLMPRRESVWWGCQCVRAIQGESPGLAAAEAWVRDPHEKTRRAALDVGNAGDKRRAATWLALAAGYSGGDIGPADRTPLSAAHPQIISPPVPAAPHMSASAIGAAVALAVGGAGRDGRAWTQACVASAIDFSGGGDAKPSLPRASAPATG